MALTQLMYMARADGKWGVFDRGPPARALVTDRSTLVEGLLQLMRTNPEVTPTALARGLGMGNATVSRTTADKLFSTLKRLGALEIT